MDVNQRKLRILVARNLVLETHTGFWQRNIFETGQQLYAILEAMDSVLEELETRDDQSNPQGDGRCQGEACPKGTQHY